MIAYSFPLYYVPVTTCAYLLGGFYTIFISLDECHSALLLREALTKEVRKQAEVGLQKNGTLSGPLIALLATSCDTGLVRAQLSSSLCTNTRSWVSGEWS